MIPQTYGKPGNQYMPQKREFLFWVGYMQDITEVVENVPGQQQLKVSFQKFKFYSGIPPHPWHTIESDLFYDKKIDFLMVINYFFKFLIVTKLPNSTMQAVKKELCDIFCEHGRPYLLRSHNDQCYASE